MSGAGSTPCVVRDDGALVCWGAGLDGELGHSVSESSATPAPVPGLPPIAQVGVGEYHSCAVDTNHDGYCWGLNDLGQVGDSTVGVHATPTAITALSGMFAELRTGQYHSCGRLIDGSVWCWGANTEGQLGDGSVNPSLVPVRAAGVVGAEHITVGDFVSCALLSDGTTTCWGDDNPIGSAQRNATVVPALAGAIDIEGGCHKHACAVLGDGTAWCWGDNSDGALGDGTTIDRTTPVQVAVLSGVVQVAVGGQHTCARLHDGAVWCWGGNAYDQLGAGNIDSVLLPFRVPGVPAADELVAGCSSTCARAGHDIYCWGQNHSGELGDGTFINRIGVVHTLDVCTP
jgi:hypothetical protein